PLPGGLQVAQRQAGDRLITEPAQALSQSEFASQPGSFGNRLPAFESPADLSARADCFRRREFGLVEPALGHALGCRGSLAFANGPGPLLLLLVRFGPRPPLPPASPTHPLPCPHSAPP